MKEVLGIYLTHRSRHRPRKLSISLQTQLIGEIAPARPLSPLREVMRGPGQERCHFPTAGAVGLPKMLPWGTRDMPRGGRHTGPEKELSTVRAHACVCVVLMQ